MKFLKGLLYFVLILAVVYLLANAFAPAEKVIERSVSINAPLAKVHSQVLNFERWKLWDPWFNRDTSQVREMHGEMGEEGYGYSWKSESDDVGNGTMDWTKIDGMTGLDYHLTFEGMGESDGYFKFEEEGESTKVTWAMISEQTFLMRWMNYMMDGWLGPDFEKGLGNLKDLVENSSDEELGLAPAGPEVTMGTVNGINYAMVREEISISTGMQEWFGKAYGAIYGFCQSNGHAPMGPASALYHTWDMENDRTDVAAAVPLSARMEEEGTEVDIEVGKATLYANSIMYSMKGAYSDEAFGGAHNSLEKWCTDNQKTMTSPVVEEYVKGPNDNIPEEEYVTNIYYYFE